MRLSDAGLAFIKKAEGFRSHTYADAKGLPTIGYGHLLTAGETYPNGIGEPYAALLLSRDAASAENAVNRLVKVALTQGQFDALVSFTYNLGERTLATSTLLRELNAGHYVQAAAEILRWNHAGHIEVAGLTARREAEHARFIEGI